MHGSLPNQSLFSGFSGGSTGKDLKLDKLHFSAILEMPWSLPRRAETGTRKKEAWMSLLRLLDGWISSNGRMDGQMGGWMVI